ncbi:hypothetical protein NW756_004643 [Fusarium oxysporum]|nr:hypothetical protein NW763_011183 [Fusarium oxysporum]KAJ4065368.1 hypothetical protein NW753_003802 [Fusarium oxysporum]KAJ4095823.1 hypothetical protein NW756_004643 [Fusarium oxysporum]
MGEKNVLCVLVSTTTWTDPTKPNDTRKAANVLLLNQLAISPNVFGRAGVGQIWDAESVAWKQDRNHIPIAALEKPNPKLEAAELQVQYFGDYIH